MTGGARRKIPCELRTTIVQHALEHGSTKTAQAFGVSRRSVTTFVQRLRPGTSLPRSSPANRIPDDVREKIADHALLHGSIAAAQTFAVSRQVVQAVVKQIRPGKKIPRVSRVMIKDRASLVRCAQISGIEVAAKKYGVSTITVRGYMKRFPQYRGALRCKECGEYERVHTPEGHPFIQPGKLTGGALMLAWAKKTLSSKEQQVFVDLLRECLDKKPLYGTERAFAPTIYSFETGNKKFAPIHT